MNAIFPSSRPNLSVRVIPKIPATMSGVGGIGVSKEDGIWTITPSWDDLALIAPGILLDPTTKEIWVHDPVTDVYNRMTLGGLGQALFWGHSVTSVLIGAGTKTFETQSGKDWPVGSFVQAISTASPTNFVIGQVTSYVGTTLTMNALAIGGSGSFADWTLVMSTLPGGGAPGATGSSAGLNYNFSAGLSGDPGAGGIGFSSATIASISSIRVSKTDRNAINLANEVATWDDSTSAPNRAKVRVYSPNAPAKFVIATISGAGVDGGTFVTFPVILPTGPTLPDVGACQVEVLRTGDMGIQGPAGVPGGVVTISDTPPLAPTHGQEWFESDTGKTYIWYNDGSSAQWIQTSGGGGGGVGGGELSVVDFGADPTGAADSSDAVIAAWTYGNSVFFPPGDFRIDDVLTYVFNGDHGLKIRGAGREVTKLIFPTNSGLGFIFGYPCNALTMEDLTLVAGVPGVGGTGAAITLFQGGVVNPKLSAFTDFCRVTCRGSDSSAPTTLNYWRIAFNVNTLSNINWHSVDVSGNDAWNGTAIELIAQTTNYGIIYNIHQSMFNKLDVGLMIKSYVQGISLTAVNITQVRTGIAILPGVIGVAELAVTGCQFGFNNASMYIWADLYGITLSNNFFYVTDNATAININAPTKSGGTFSITGNHFEGHNTVNTVGVQIVSAPLGSHGVISSNNFYNLYKGVQLDGASNGTLIGSNGFGDVAFPVLDFGTKSIVLTNPGYVPAPTGQVYPAASGATYTGGATFETHYITGGTVSAIKVAGAVISTTTPCQVHLGPNETFVIDYTVAPAQLIVRH